MIRIFIGYDEGEKIAFHVLSESIRRLSSEPVSIIPLDLNTIRNHFKRDNRIINQLNLHLVDSWFLIYLIMKAGLSLWIVT